MATLRNVSKQSLAVGDGGERKEIAPGQSVEVSNRADWGKHLFVRAGWLEAAKDAPKRKTKSEKPGEDKPDDTEKPEQG